jgi:glyceraldehyde 3-phosphate dehydrogenase
MSTLTAGINGFGRFGLHLLKYWLDHREPASFQIDWINDDHLSATQAFRIILTDNYVKFNEYRVQIKNDSFVFTCDRFEHVIRYTNCEAEALPWIGKPDLLFECSGKRTRAAHCAHYMTGVTQRVIISATSWDADKTLVYGFNQHEFDAERHRIISYGSCTVNTYVPLAQFINQQFGVLDSDVWIAHNLPEYRLSSHQTLQRRPCTLQLSAPNLLPFISAERNFFVTYTVLPYSGVSMIDFRFRLTDPVDRLLLVDMIRQATMNGPLAHLYSIEKSDRGPHFHQGSPFSAVLIESGIKLLGGNLYLQGYFDNENSASRFFDLVNYLGRRLMI